MRRALLWLGAAAPALLGQVLDNESLRGAGAFALAAALAGTAPGLLPAAAVMAIVLALLWIAAGPAATLDAIPALIAAFVGWLFARTLRRGRRPLIARAIAALDGADRLADPAIAAYARRLTAVWAGWQFFLALCAALLALHARGLFAPAASLPSPRAFGIAGLPLAVTLLFLAEFFLRPHLLPQAPRRGLCAFARGLVRHWPALLDERAVADGRENRDAGRSS